MHRDLGPGDSGEDVRQLERALARLGHPPGPIDGATTARRRPPSPSCIAATTPRRSGSPTARPSGSSTAASAVAAATDHLLQTRVALRGARADVNQAQLDAAAVAESIPTARAAIIAARTRIAEARDLFTIAKRLERSGDPTARRELAAAQVDLTAKQNALDEAIGARDDAQRDLTLLPRTPRPSAPRRARRCASRWRRSRARAPTSPPPSSARTRGQARPQRVDPPGARRRAQGQRATSRSPRPTPSRGRARSPRWGASTGSRARACGSSARRPRTAAEADIVCAAMRGAAPRAGRVLAAGGAQRHPGARRRGPVLRADAGARGLGRRRAAAASSTATS